MSDRITVRMSQVLLASIDAWILERGEPMSRQEALRRCVETMVLGTAGRRPKEPPVIPEAPAQDEATQVVWLDT